MNRDPSDAVTIALSLLTGALLGMLLGIPVGVQLEQLRRPPCMGEQIPVAPQPGSSRYDAPEYFGTEPAPRKRQP
jgi:hypothetical protein